MQNFRTKGVALNQSQYEAIESFPDYRVENYKERTLAPETYKVIDVWLTDGRILTGLLVFDDSILIPESEADFQDVDILRMEPTPEENIPDFTITDTECLWEGEGKNRGIELSNWLRESAFGPVEADDEPDWRSEPIEKCWKEALDTDRKVRTYRNELPAAIHGISGVKISPEGVTVSLYTASSEERKEYTLKPKTAEVWAEILESDIEIDPETTFRDILELVDLPTDVDREVYMRVMPNRRNSFQQWIESSKQTPEDEEKAEKIEYLIIKIFADEMDERYSLSYGLGSESFVLEEDYNGHQKGERINWSLLGVSPASLVDAKVRIDDKLVFPLPHEEHMKFLRGEYREWSRGPKDTERPKDPEAFSCTMRITLRDALRAIFREITPYHVKRGAFIDALLNEEDDEE